MKIKKYEGLGGCIIYIIMGIIVFTSTFVIGNSFTGRTSIIPFICLIISLIIISVYLFISGIAEIEVKTYEVKAKEVR